MPTPKEGYRLLDGTRVPGTTTIIGRFKDSSALLYWACEQGKAIERGEIQKLYDKRDQAADTGTMAHDCVELHIHGKNPFETIKPPKDMLDHVMSSYEAYLIWENQTKLQIIATEIQLVHEDLRFGGTPDAIGLINGELVLLDWKTSNGIFADYLIQLAAYKLLIEEGHYNGSDRYFIEDLWKMYPNAIVSGYHLLRFAKEHGDFCHHYYKDLSEAERQFILFREAYDIDKQLAKRAK